MAQHNDTGAEGEALACQYLIQHGFAILHTNWRQGKYEADIIAYREGLIVFVEVKTRHGDDYGNPEEFVDIKKQRAYIRMADNYVITHRRDEEVRFDIIAITHTPSGCHIDHIENAFSAAGLYL